MPWIEWGSAVLSLAAVVLIACRLRGAALWAARPLQRERHRRAVEAVHLDPARGHAAARIAMFPRVAVHVHDAGVAGVGILHAALPGLVTLAALRTGDELAQGELMRFMAEAAWHPTALLPSQGVQWQAVDDRSVRAPLSDGRLRVTLTFHFGSDWVGHVDSVVYDPAP